MVKRNPNFLNLADNYLFLEVQRQVKEFKERCPKAELLSLSIGDTSEPLPPTAAQGLITKSAEMQTRTGYCGYGPESGNSSLRAKISSHFYKGRIAADEIFISDGAKCDIGRLQLLFGPECTIALQDPTYPAYADNARLMGTRSITYLDCSPKNGFFPNLTSLNNIDLLYLCSPNNPTGAVATKKQITELIDWAKNSKALIIFDAAYSGFIQDPTLPRSIYDAEGADEVAIEISSFSKLIGFTGVRTAWSVIPKKLQFEGGHEVHRDFSRLMSTAFNGASIISQAGALSALSEKGLQEMQELLSFYMTNARLIKTALENKGICVYGGDNAPYLWADFGKKKSSWGHFHDLLETCGLITTPGSGFGTQGEGFIRFSAFGSRENILRAVKRIEERL